jgi:hypothetical protein
MSVYLIAGNKDEAEALHELFPGPKVYIGPKPSDPVEATDTQIQIRVEAEARELDGAPEAVRDMFRDLASNLRPSRRPTTLPQP